MKKTTKAILKTAKTINDNHYPRGKECQVVDGELIVVETKQPLARRCMAESIRKAKADNGQKAAREEQKRQLRLCINGRG